MKQLTHLKETMTSLEIAQLTGKEHFHVMRDIREMLEQLSISNTSKTGFFEIINNLGKKVKYPLYNLDKELTYTLVAGYNIKLRNAIVKHWLALEEENIQLKAERNATKLMFRKMTDSIKKHIPEASLPNGYKVYMQEAEMINEIVLGIPSYKYRKLMLIDKADDIRDSMSAEQLAAIEKKEEQNAVLIELGINTTQRKALLSKGE